MYYFHPPQQNLPLLFLTLVVVAHSISFHVFRAILLYDMNTKFRQDYEELLNITNTFDIVYYVFLGIGAVILELIASKFSFVLLLMVLSPAGQIIYYVSENAFLSEATYLIVAALSATIKIGLIAYGAAEYTGIDCLNVCKYFAIIHIVETVGHLMALRFIKLQMLINSVCGRLSCSYYAMIWSLLFEIIALVAFSYCNMSSNGVKDAGKSFITGIPKLGRILIVFTPFLIVWINYGDGIWRWIAQAKLMKCQVLWYSLSGLNMLTVDLIATIICAIGLYLVMAYSNYIVSKPIIVIGFGGCLMSIAMILSSYLYATLKFYEIPKTSARTSILYFVDHCHSTKFYNYNLTVDFNSTSIHFEDDQYINRHVWNLNGSRDCYTLTMKISYHKTNYKSETIGCFREKCSYIIQVNCRTNSPKQSQAVPFKYHIQVYGFASNRHQYAHPKLCIINTETHSHTGHYVRLQKTNNPDVHYTAMTNDNLTCRTIKEGQYDYRKNYVMIGKDINFRYGGVYLLVLERAETITLAEIHKPLEVTIWYLLAIIYVTAFGKNCIIITGMFVIYNQSPPCVRTIAIGSWFMIITSGYVIFTSADQVGRQVQKTSFMFTGLLIFAMTVIFILYYVFNNMWSFKCDTVAVKEVDRILEEHPEPCLPIQSDQCTETNQLSEANQLLEVNQLSDADQSLEPVQVSTVKRKPKATESLHHFKPVLQVEYHHRKH